MVVLFSFDVSVYNRRGHLAKSERADSEPGDEVSSASKLSKTSDYKFAHAFANTNIRTCRVRTKLKFC